MGEFEIPVVLRQQIRVAGLVSIFINDIQKRVEGLEGWSVQSPANGQRQALERVDGIGEIAAWKQAPIITGYDRILLQAVSGLVGGVGGMFVTYSGLVA